MVQRKESQAQGAASFSQQGGFFTADCWTALTAESDITVTCHFVDKAWHLKSAVLLTKAKPVRHTAETQAEKLNKAVWT